MEIQGTARAVGPATFSGQAFFVEGNGLLDVAGRAISVAGALTIPAGGALVDVAGDLVLRATAVVTKDGSGPAPFRYGGTLVDEGARIIGPPVPR